MARSRRKSSWGGATLSLIVIIIASAAAFGFWRFSRQPFENFKAETINTTSVIRVHNGPTVNLPALLNEPEVQNRVRKGAGIKQVFTKVTPAGKTIERSCEMEGWVAPSQLANSIRQSENTRLQILPQFLNDCAEKLAWLNSREPYPVRLLFVVDPTDGVGNPGGLPVKFVSDELNLGRLKDSFDAGDTIELFGCKFSAQRQANCETAKADKNHAWKSVEDLAAWLARPEPRMTNSSVYEAMANIFDWFKSRGVQVPETVMITDGSENNNETANFYELAKAGKLADTDFPNLAKKVFARRQLPELADTSITLIGPPKGEGAERVRIERSLAFAAYALGEVKATVKVRYQ